MQVRNSVFWLFIVVSAVIAAGEGKATTAPRVLFGEAIPADLRERSLTQAVSEINQVQGDQVLSGRVTQVCQKAGCWMIVTDGDIYARVMTDYKFELPKDLKGKVSVFGKLESVDLGEREAAHLAKDVGESKSMIALREYRIRARGVTLH